MIVQRHPGRRSQTRPFADVEQLAKRFGRSLHKGGRTVQGAQQGQAEDVEDDADHDMAALLVGHVQRFPTVHVNVHHDRFQNKQRRITDHEQDREGRYQVGDEIPIGDHHHQKEQSSGQGREAVTDTDDLGDFVSQPLEFEVRLGEHDYV